MAQVRVDSSQEAHLYETVPVVDGSPILRDLLFSPDHRHIYLLSEKQVGPGQVAGWAGGRAQHVLTRLCPGEPAPGGDLRAIPELRGLPGLGGPALWLVRAATQVRTCLALPMAGGRGACPLPRAHPTSCALVASLPSNFLLLMSRTSGPSDVSQALGDEAEACGCLAPYAGQAAPLSPLPGPQGSYGMGLA